MEFVLSSINFILSNYMCFMPTHHMKKVSCTNIEICSFEGRIIVKNSLRAHVNGHAFSAHNSVIFGPKSILFI